MEDYLDKINLSFQKLDLQPLEEMINLLTESIGERTRIFIAGNGGSAATASHFATDLNKSQDAYGNFGRAISLCDNVSMITAIGNDDEFENIFAAQLINLASSMDVLVLISASGNSENLVRALAVSRNIGMKTVGLLGFDGGRLLNQVDFAIHTKTDKGDYGPAEDAHSIVCHYVTDRVRKNLQTTDFRN